MYGWEKSAPQTSARKAKAAGTVVFHPNDHYDPEFAPLVAKARMRLQTQEALKSRLGFERLLPAQAHCYDGIFKHRDVLLHSRTGSGKTLAYALPLVERFFIAECDAAQTGRAALPFLLVFVFSNELAVQTRDVLTSVYGDSLRVAVAGYDDSGEGAAAASGEGAAAETATAGKKAAAPHVLIGTVPALATAILGAHNASRAASRAAGADASKKKRAGAAPAAGDKAAAAKRRRREGGSEDGSDDDSNDDNDDEEAAAGGKAGDAEDEEQDPDADDEDEDDGVTAAAGTVDVSGVRAIVIDECDTTLGPTFSKEGRLVKKLLRAVRAANGSRTDRLAGPDFRAHHYVLCGATIPNWVIKAGFLGVKKYYFRLVSAGSSKLPPQLACYAVDAPRAPAPARGAAKPAKADPADPLVLSAGPLRAVVDLLCDEKQQKADPLGRCVVFVASSKMAQLERALREASAARAKGRVVPASLAKEKTERERIQCIADFNAGRSNVLLCTDVAGRGLDFVAVDTVLMTSVPCHRMASEVFVHRAGRTARVNAAGRCIVVCDSTRRGDAEALRALETVTHVQFRKLLSSAGAAETTRLRLRVRSAFAPEGAAGGVPTPQEVLQKALGAEANALVRSTSTVAGDATTIVFEVAADQTHRVKKLLWKYDVREEAAVVPVAEPAVASRLSPKLLPTTGTARAAPVVGVASKASLLPPAAAAVATPRARPSAGPAAASVTTPAKASPAKAAQQTPRPSGKAATPAAALAARSDDADQGVSVSKPRRSGASPVQTPVARASAVAAPAATAHAPQAAALSPPAGRTSPRSNPATPRAEPLAPPAPAPTAVTAVKASAGEKAARQGAKPRTSTNPAPAAAPARVAASKAPAPAKPAAVNPATKKAPAPPAKRPVSAVPSVAARGVPPTATAAATKKPPTPVAAGKKPPLRF